MGFAQTAKADDVYYSVLGSDGKTMTVYYDGKMSQRGGTSPYKTEWRECVTKVVFDTSVKNFKPSNTMKGLFSKFEKLETIEHLNYLTTENVKDMSYVFNGCKSLKSLDLSNFKTNSATDISYMFYECSSLTSLDVSKFETGNVTNMEYLFYNCSNVTSLDVSHFDTKNVTSMKCMFSGCSGVTELDVSGFDTRNVTDMTSMFNSCKKLSSLNVNSFDLTNVTSTKYMFYYCSSLRTIYCNNDWSKYSQFYYGGYHISTDMFDKCFWLTGGNGFKYQEDATEIGYACPNTEKNEGYFTEIKDLYAVLTDNTVTFYYDTKKDERNGNEYWKNSSLQNSYTNIVTKVVFDQTMDKARPTSTANWFAYLSNLKEIFGMPYLHTDEVTDMSYMFAGCRSLENIDASRFNTSKVTNMELMFFYCTKLKVIDISNFDVTNVQKAGNMFALCSELTTIICKSDWSGHPFIEAQIMFSGATNLIGQNGTTYDNDHIDAEYARPDGINGKKGYFSDHLITYRTVTYVDWNGDELYVEQVADGKNAKGPDTDPEREGYAFTGWDKPLTNITSNLTVTATYEANTYVVTVDEVENGEIRLLDVDIDLTAVPYGTTLFFEAVPDKNYELDSWTNYDEENGLLVTDNVIVSATFRLQTFAVTFDSDGYGHIEVEEEGIDLDHVPYGTVLHLVAVPDPGYEFAGWVDYDPDEGLKVTENVTVSVSFKEASLLVTFIDINGDDIGEPQSVNYGEAAVAPEVPEVEGFVFIGWDTDFSQVTTDLVVKAQYLDLSKEETVLYVAIDGTTMTVLFDNMSKTHPLTYDMDDISSDVRNATRKVVIDPSVNNTTVTTLYNGFANMPNLETVEGLNNINTGELTDVSFMFMNCSSLTSIDLNGFDLSGVTSAYGMFMGCSNLATILCNADYTALAGDASVGMFQGCTSLVGGKGTTYSTAHKDASYARPDGGSSAPGYFTAKDTETGLEDASSADGGTPRKQIRGGVLYILRNGILYTLQGTPL